MLALLKFALVWLSFASLAMGAQVTDIELDSIQKWRSENVTPVEIRPASQKIGNFVAGEGRH